LKEEHETHLPTEQPASQTDARLSRTHGDPGRTRGPQEASRQGSQALDRDHSGQAAELSTVSTGPSQRFPARFRLRKRHEFLALQRDGRRLTLSHFVVITRDRDQPPSRLGITTSRKVGNAPVRNRIRRLVRDVFRRRRETIVPPRDVLVIARPGAGSLDYADVDHELTRALRLAARS
jgi:ribonuclease P protein component